MTCSYRGCKGEYGHGSPHLFEATQVENFERDAASFERDAIVRLFGRKPTLTRRALLAEIVRRPIFPRGGHE